MKDPVYELIELTGTSSDSIEDAVDSVSERFGIKLADQRLIIHNKKDDLWRVRIYP
jgi:hypothetical protein